MEELSLPRGSSRKGERKGECTTTGIMVGDVSMSQSWTSRSRQQKEDILDPHWSLHTRQNALPHIRLPFFVNNRTARNNFHTAVLSGTTKITMIKRWYRKESASHLGEEDVDCHGSKNICVAALEREAGLATKQRLVHAHQPCQMRWLLQPANKVFGGSNLWTYVLVYLNIQVKPTNDPLSWKPLRRSLS